jgi:hypothetical protein
MVRKLMVLGMMSKAARLHRVLEGLVAGWILLTLQQPP